MKPWWNWSATKVQNLFKFHLSQRNLRNHIVVWLYTVILYYCYSFLVRCTSFNNIFDTAWFLRYKKFKSYQPKSLVVSTKKLSNLCTGWQWRYFGPYPCQLVSATILWVKLLEMFVTLMSHKYASSDAAWWSCGHFPQLTVFPQLCSINVVNLRLLISHTVPSYTHKMAIVSWRHFTLYILLKLCRPTRCCLLARNLD